MKSSNASRPVLPSGTNLSMFGLFSAFWHSKSALSIGASSSSLNGRSVNVYPPRIQRCVWRKQQTVATSCALFSTVGTCRHQHDLQLTIPMRTECVAGVGSGSACCVEPDVRSRRGLLLVPLPAQPRNPAAAWADCRMKIRCDGC